MARAGLLLLVAALLFSAGCTPAPPPLAPPVPPARAPQVAAAAASDPAEQLREMLRPTILLREDHPHKAVARRLQGRGARIETGRPDDDPDAPRAVVGVSFGDYEPLEGTQGVRFADPADVEIKGMLDDVLQLKDLQRLRLREIAITDADLTRLVALKRLESLDITGSRVTPAGLAVLQGLPNLKRLSCRSLWKAESEDAFIDDGGGDWLRADNSRMTNIEENYITADDLAPLAGLTKLEEFDFDASALTDDALPNLARLTALRKLNLSGAQITSAGIKHLAALKNLRMLNLSSTQVRDLQPLGALPELEVLIWANNDARVTGLEHLPALIELDLSGARHDDRPSVFGALSSLTGNRWPFHAEPSAGVDLRQLSGADTLRALKLAATDVTDRDLKPLEGLVDIEELDLSQTGIGDAGVKRLTAVRSLMKLNLSKTSITDEAIAHLCGMPHLRELNLGATAITDAAAATLGQMRRLRNLDVDDTQLSRAGAAQLNQSLELESKIRASDFPDEGFAVPEATFDLAEFDRDELAHKLPDPSEMTPLPDGGFMGPGHYRWPGDDPHLVFSTDGKWLAAASYRMLAVFDTAAGQHERTIYTPEAVEAIAFLDGGRMLILAGGEFSVRDVEGEESETLDVEGGCRKFGVSRDRTRLAGVDSGGNVFVLDLNARKRVQTLKGDAEVHALALSADGRRLVTGGDDQAVRLWDVEGGDLLHKFSIPGQAQAVAFSHDDFALYAVSAKKGAKETVHAWSVDSGNPIEAFTGLEFSEAFAPSPTAPLLFTDHDYKTLVHARHANGKSWMIGGHRPLYALAVSPDGKMLATTGDGPAGVTLKLWDLSALGKEE